ncbi:nicotinamide-nucleotide amidohydrolase family protein [Maricaulis sp.]|uniref:CinA family protein n=1 Tax=Maricaulis sp. TaxID=1486257 RepID=UPI0025C632EB|nr:nicotinamide-nucleotide amidohydrolase family protein [Maricaulis sp.]
MMFNHSLLEQAETLLDRARTAGVMIATAESCTGGLVAALMTEIPGSSDVVDRGFVTYSNAAKTEMLGVPARVIEANGAVSVEVARRMADEALLRSNADIAVSITGVAGPGGSEHKPAGLVHFALACRDKPTRTEIRRFGDRGREAVRLASVATALDLLADGVDFFG